MSKVQEDLVVQLGLDDTIMAFRKAAMSLGVIQELGEGHFQIKETDNGYSAGTVFMDSGGGMGFATNKTYNPATSDILIRSIDANQTSISILVSNFGFGPIQTKHCNGYLSTIKSAIIVAVNEYARSGAINKPNSTETGQEGQVAPQPLIKSVPVANKQTDGGHAHNHTLAIILVSILAIAKIVGMFVYGGKVFYLIYKIAELVVGAIGIILCGVHIKKGDKAPLVYVLLGIAGVIEIWELINLIRFII